MRPDFHLDPARGPFLALTGEALCPADRSNVAEIGAMEASGLSGPPTEGHLNVLLLVDDISQIVSSGEFVPTGGS